jgi:hypothetical protein
MNTENRSLPQQILEKYRIFLEMEEEIERPSSSTRF